MDESNPLFEILGKLFNESEPDFEGGEPFDLDASKAPGCCDIHNALWACYQAAKGRDTQYSKNLLLQSVKDVTAEFEGDRRVKAVRALGKQIASMLPKMDEAETGRWSVALAEASARVCIGTLPEGAQSMVVAKGPTGYTVIDNGGEPMQISRNAATFVAAAHLVHLAKDATREEQRAFEKLLTDMLQQEPK